MPELPNNPTMKDFQRYVSELEQERGFAHQTELDKALLLGEEMGELFKALRKRLRLGVDKKSEIGAVSEEIVDMLIYLFAIANRVGIDLESSFREKEEINKKRIWS